VAREHSYQARVIWSGSSAGGTTSYAAYSREYRVEVPGKPPLRGSADPLFRGDGALHNPEDLLVIALSTCHMLTYLALAARAGLVVLDYEDRASGTLTLEGGGGRFTEVVLRPVVSLAAGSDRELARRLHERAHADCYIASSMSFPVRCEPVLHETGRSPA
jgi:organic hydroperoxide reductase OsmC/OhrA